MKLSWSMILVSCVASAMGTWATSIPNQKKCYHVAGDEACEFFKKAVKIGELLADSKPDTVQIHSYPYPSKDWPENMSKIKAKIDGAEDHSASPLIWEACGDKSPIYVGNATEFEEFVSQAYLNK